MAAEVASGVRLVCAAEAERARHEHAPGIPLGRVDPAGLAASPDWARVGTAQLVATTAGRRALRSQLKPPARPQTTFEALDKPGEHQTVGQRGVSA